MLNCVPANYARLVFSLERWNSCIKYEGSVAFTVRLSHKQLPFAWVKMVNTSNVLWFYPAVGAQRNEKSLPQE